MRMKELAPIFAFAPMVMGPSSVADVPTKPLSASVGWRLPFSQLVPPRVALAAVLAGPAQRHVVEQHAVVADVRRLGDLHAGAVVDEEASPDSRSGVNFHSGEKARQGREQPRQQRHPVADVERVCDPVEEDRVERRMTQQGFDAAGGGGVVALHDAQVFQESLEHVVSFAPRGARG